MTIKTIEQQAYITAADTPASMSGEWEAYFSLLETLDIPVDFMENRMELLLPDQGER